MKRPTDAPAGLRDFLKNVVRRHFPSEREARMIDIGCGMGLLVQIARDAGYANVSGVDLSPQMVAAAGRLGIDGIREGDALDALRELDDGSHDAVIGFDILEHLTRDEMFALIDEVHRVLRPGGRWIIHTVNAESIFFGRVRYGDLTHEQAFTQASLRQALLASGFSDVTCFEDAPIPGRPAATMRFLLWKLSRIFLLISLFAESGPVARSAILSQNLLAVAIR